MRRRAARWLLVTLLLALLAGCGFHLRGSMAPPAWLQTLYLTADGSISDELNGDLRRALVAAGLTVVDKPEGATLLQLSEERYRRQLMTVSLGGRVKEYSLSYEVRLSLQDADGKSRLGKEAVTVFRELVYDEEHVLAMASEEELVREEMRRALIMQILRVLHSEHLRQE